MHHIYLCECNVKNFMANLFQSSMAVTSVSQKSICICQDCKNKVFMFTIKEVWDRVRSPENQFFNISSCKWPSTSSLLGIEELLMSYYLFIFSSHQHVQHMTSQILLILIDFDSFLDTFDLKLLIFKPL